MKFHSVSLVLSSILLISCGSGEASTSAPQDVTKVSNSEPTEVKYSNKSVQIGFPARPKELIFKSFAYDLGENNKLSKGDVVEVPDWPGVLNTKTCTASLIGPDTVLTAAHCVDAGYANSPENPRGRYETISTKLDWFDREIDLTCEMSDAYTAVDGGQPLRNIHDQALCFISGSAPTIQEAKGLITNSTLYERIDVSGTLTTAGSKITMAGFGCYDHRPYKVESKLNPGKFMYWINFSCDHSTDGPFIRRLRIGHDTINDYNMVLDGDFTPAIFDKKVKLINYSRGQSNEPSVCVGDSGGPLFSGHQALNPGDQGRRRVIGVNSSIDIANLYPTSDLVDPYDYNMISSMASLSNPEFISFLERWALKHKTKVCIDGYSGGQDIVSSSSLCRN